jgi:aminoglycoside phosphotransferase
VRTGGLHYDVFNLTDSPQMVHVTVTLDGPGTIRDAVDEDVALGRHCRSGEVCTDGTQGTFSFRVQTKGLPAGTYSLSVSGSGTETATAGWHLKPMAHTHVLTFDGDVVRKRFVSWGNGEDDREWAGLNLLDRHASGLAPRPLDKETQADAPVVVMSRVPGESLGGADLSESQLHGLSSALGRLFAVPIESGLEERAWGPSTMRAGIREWIADEYDLGRCRDRDLVYDAIQAARAWLAHERPALDRIVDPVIARGDGNLDNALWDGETCRLVDFEEFGISDIAYEIADVAEHASSRLGRRLDPDALIATVGLTTAQLDRLASYRTLMATFWLVMLLPGNGGFRRNPAGSTEDQATHVLALLDGGR